MGQLIRGPWPRPEREHDDDGQYAALTLFVLLPLSGLAWIELLTWLAGNRWPL